MVTTGKRQTPKEIERYIDQVTTEEIKRVAQKYLWDKDVSGNPDLDMSMVDRSWMIDCGRCSGTYGGTTRL